MPDTMLDPPPHPGTDQSYHIDVNQDGINDIAINSHAVISPGTSDENIYVTSLDTNTKFCFLKTDSVFYPATCGGPYWNTTGILKPYGLLDTVKGGNYVTSGYISRYGVMGLCSPQAPVISSSEWIDSTDHYIGVSRSTASGVVYGWIRINVTNYQTVLIKDFSLGIPVNIVKEFSTSIPQGIYPNPAAEKIYISAAEPQEVKISDAIGNEVVKTKAKEVDISRMNDGIYFIEVRTREGRFTQKLIVHHESLQDQQPVRIQLNKNKKQDGE